MSKSKVTVEERIEAAKSCAEGRMSIAEVARRLGVGSSRVSEWVSQYKVRGDAFSPSRSITTFIQRKQSERQWRSI